MKLQTLRPALILAMLAGCDTLLDVDPINDIAEDQAITGPVSARAAVAGRVSNARSSAKRVQAADLRWRNAACERHDENDTLNMDGFLPLLPMSTWGRRSDELERDNPGRDETSSPRL